MVDYFIAHQQPASTSSCCVLSGVTRSKAKRAPTRTSQKDKNIEDSCQEWFNNKRNKERLLSTTTTNNYQATSTITS
jgi:hypothetical protein